MQAARLRLFEGLGRALLKALMDQITVPCGTFAPSLFRFLLGRAGPGGMPLTDLEEFDPALARQLNDHILGTHIGDGSALGLDFTGLRGSRKDQDDPNNTSTASTRRTGGAANTVCAVCVYRSERRQVMVFRCAGCHGKARVRSVGKPGT